MDTPRFKILEPAELSDLAWRLINEIVQTKRATIPIGVGSVIVDDEQWVKLLFQISTLKMKTRKTSVRKPENWAPKETKE